MIGSGAMASEGMSVYSGVGGRQVWGEAGVGDGGERCGLLTAWVVEPAGFVMHGSQSPLLVTAGQADANKRARLHQFTSSEVN